MPPLQTALDLTPNPDFRFERFERGLSNQLAVNAVEAWPDWPSPILVISGPAGTGKTHIGQAWREKANGVSFFGTDIDDITLLGEGRAVFIDRAEHSSEHGLFSVMNLALNGTIPSLLLATRHPPTQWQIRLPDLNSRLKNANHITLGEHEDELLEPIIRKLFDDRGRHVSKDIVRYIIKYCDRSVANLREFVLDLDTHARITKSDITRSFVAKFRQSNYETQLD